MTVKTFHGQCEILSKNFNHTINKTKKKETQKKKKDSTNQNTDKPDIETGTVKHGDQNA